MMNYGTTKELAQQPKEIRASQVQQQVDRGIAIMARMEEKMKSLYMRLQPVLSDAPPTGAETNPKPTLVGHAQALSNHNDQLQALDVAFGDILDRLEL